MFCFLKRKFVEISFFERDRIGEFSLIEGDIVQFKVATDKRTSLKRAIDVLLMENSLLNNKRECGVVDLLCEVNNNNNNNNSNSNTNIHLNNINKYGAIKSIERDELVYFTLNEFLTLNKSKSISFDIGDCVEFTVVDCVKVNDNELLVLFRLSFIILL